MVILLVKLDVVRLDAAVPVSWHWWIPRNTDSVRGLEVVGQIRRWTTRCTLLTIKIAHLLLTITHVIPCCYAELVVNASLFCNNIVRFVLIVFDYLRIQKIMRGSILKKRDFTIF